MGVGVVHPHPFLIYLSMTFIEFTATATQLEVTIDDTSQPTGVTFKLHDLTEATVTTPSSTSGTEYTYIYATDASDGIYTCTVNDGEADEIVAFISNMLQGINCLLQKTLREEYDCRLIQELEAVKQYTFLQKEDLARNVYTEVERRCTTCEASYVEGLSGISIWIIDNDFIVQ